MKAKNTVKALTFLACGVLAAGALTLNTNTAETVKAAEIPTIAMKEGASVRVPDITTDLEGTTYSNNGLRFTAKINKATYDGWVTNGYTVTQGTFIMPVEYFTANTPNETTCFGTGENLKYYWNTAGKGETPVYSAENTTGLKEVIHVEAPVYVKDGDTDVYTINGSITNLLDETMLEGNLIGVSYIKKVKDTTTEYIFAETDTTNARNAAFVAQAALVEKDEAFNSPEKIEAVETDYVENYIGLYFAKNGEYPKAYYTVNEYKQTSTGFVNTPVVKSVQVNAVPTEITYSATESAKSNYVYDVDNANNALTVTPRFDGKKAEVTAYYNYTGNRATILDFEGEDPFKGGRATERFRVNTEDEWVADGTGSARVGAYGSNYAWVEGLTWDKPIELPFATDTFTFDLYTPSLFDGLGGNEYIYVRAVGLVEHGWSGTSLTNANEYDSTSKVDSSYVFEEGVYNVTVKFEVKLSSIYTLYFSSRPGGEGVRQYYVDNFCAVNTSETNGLYIEQNVPEFIEDGKVEFNAKAKATNLFEDEITDMTFTAQYSEYGANSWTTLTETDGKYSFDATATKYEVKLTGTCNGTTVEKICVVDDPNSGLLMWDFDEKSFDGSAWGGHSSYSALSNEWSNSGTYSWKITSSMNDYVGTGTAFVCDRTVTKIAFWSNSPVVQKIVLHMDVAEFVVVIPKGISYNVYDLKNTAAKPVSGTKIGHLYIGKASPWGTIPNIAVGTYFDDIMFF